MSSPGARWAAPPSALPTGSHPPRREGQVPAQMTVVYTDLVTVPLFSHTVAQSPVPGMVS